MNRSTGLPIKLAVGESAPEPLQNPLKQSFATTISVLGAVGCAPVPSEVLDGFKPKVDLKYKFSKRVAGGSARRGASSDAGGPKMSQYGYSQTIGAPSARLSQVDIDLGSASNRLSTLQLQEEVFVDKRTHRGQQLFVGGIVSPNAKTTVNAANLGFALSPLARRG